jgi:hypothetical protein
MSWDKDAAKSEYSVTDMSVAPHVTYFFDKKKRFMSAYMRPTVYKWKDAPKVVVGWNGDDVPQYIRDVING